MAHCGKEAKRLIEFISRIKIQKFWSQMEESLRKLKKVRERGGAGAGQGAGKAGGGLSDDDKIRLQIYVDVMFFSR